MATASFLISLVAISISLLALWKTHFAPFSALAVAGRLILRIYPIKSEAERWFIASLDVPVSVTNEGARPGVVNGLRLRLHFPNIPIPGNSEYIQPTYEVATENAKHINTNRFEWTEQIVMGDWMPFAVVPKTTVTKHFVFETRWEDPVIQPLVDCTLEIRSDSNIWQEVTSWRLTLDAQLWSELVNEGVAFTYQPEGTETILQNCVPRDLHKYTGTNSQIPEGGSFRHTSYLDYPKKDLGDGS